jgi:trimeric autotransporter adhesin
MALVWLGGKMYAGGYFTEVDGQSAGYVASWDGTAWDTMGGGASSSIYTLLAWNGQVIAGGEFTSFAGTSASRIASWDDSGASASALGAGVNDAVYSLACETPSSTDLYVGGKFTQAGGNSAVRIAKWDGSSWSALGTGIGSSFVYALLFFKGKLVAGGDFTTAGGNTVNRIAQWDGSSWGALTGGGVSGTSTNVVQTLAVNNSILYIGGRFTSAGERQGTGVGGGGR